jgi:hypothetical protein
MSMHVITDGNIYLFITHDVGGSSSDKNFDDIWPDFCALEDPFFGSKHV